MMGEGGSLYSRTLVRAIRVSVIPESFFSYPWGLSPFRCRFSRMHSTTSQYLEVGFGRLQRIKQWERCLNHGKEKSKRRKALLVFIYLPIEISRFPERRDLNGVGCVPGPTYVISKPNRHPPRPLHPSLACW